MSDSERAAVNDLLATLAKGREGIGLDVDDTLSLTTATFFARMHQEFGAPPSSTLDGLRAEFRYVGNVPYWQHGTARDFIAKQSGDPQWQMELRPVDGAVAGVAELHQLLPIRVYITARPVSMIASTQRWLVNNGFPPAPILARPDSVPESMAGAWKAAVLDQLYPAVRGIVDDNASLVTHLLPGYRGLVILIGGATPATPDRRVHAVADWSQVTSLVRPLIASPSHVGPEVC